MCVHVWLHANIDVKVQKTSHGNLNLHNALRTTIHGIPQDVRHGISHETCYVHGKSRGYSCSMSWTCWLFYNYTLKM